jgi:hypothetical protein
MATVNVFGHAVPKMYIYGGAGVAVVGGVLIVRKRKASAAAAVAATSATDTTGTTDPSIDPATGVPYADETGDGGYGGYDASTGGYGYVDGNGQYIYPGTGVTTSTAPTVSTNAEWAQEVTSYFAGNGDAGSYPDAIGKALQGMCLTSAQLQLWDNAVAFMGQPPSPPSVAPHVCAGSTPKPTTAVPNVVGKLYATAASQLTRAGFKAARQEPNVGIVTSQSPRSGEKVAKGSTITLSGKGLPVKKGK